MKRILKAFAVIICMMLCTYAYTQTLTVKFTGRDQTGQHYVKLDHVKTFNLDQLWEEVLYFPDTTLVLGGVGIIDYGNSSNSQLEQNVPNPFNGTTHFTLYLREGADALLEVFDLMGKTITSQYYANLSAGAHLFSANLTNPQVYILKVTVKNEQMHLKIVNKGYGTENSISHVSTSSPNGEFELGTKDSQALGIYPFQNGDELQHTGYTVINGVEYKSETIIQQQNESETMILHFNFTLPTVTTSAINPINNSSIQCGGNVTYDGGLSVTARGVCWNTLSNPTINDNHTIDGSGTGSFTSNITDLAPGVTHYFRAYATNGAGTVYGEQRSYSTQPILPTVTTSAVSNITATSATCGGNVTSTGGAAVYSRGICWSTSQNPTIADNHITDGSGIGNFIISLTNLSPGTTYYVRAFATNSVGTAYGEQMYFITFPNVTTSTISNITNISAICGGTIISNSTITTRGVCWSTSQNPTINDDHTTDGNGTGDYVSNITNLTPCTIYYIRAYATDITGTSYGEERSFTTLDFICGNAQVIDINNNTYNTVHIGNQCWMKENLRTTHYANGTGIPLGNDTSTTTAYRYYPDNDSANVSNYGYLYNWSAVMHNASSSSNNPSGVQGICPNGWHVPSNAEWTQLENYVGSQTQYQCGSNSTYIAKALAANTGWYSGDTATCAIGNNLNTNNSTGFSALPAGAYWGSHYTFISNAFFWSATGEAASYPHNAHYRLLSNESPRMESFGVYPFKYGFSVRCVCDMPLVTTYNVSEIIGTSATCGGEVTADGGVSVTARGVCWSTLHNPTIENTHTIDGSGTGSFISTLTGLTEGSIYYVRAYATTSIGTEYGNEVSFTATTLPTVTTMSVSNITSNSATCGGNVISDGGTPIIARGICWSTSQNPTISDAHTINGNGIGSYYGNMTNLSQNNTYYVRAYATNSMGTSYGEQRSFISIDFVCGTSMITDYDDNTYNTVQIGNQCWIKENLRTTHYEDGVNIALGSSLSTTTAYRYYPDNDSSNVGTYGYLYNWPAVMHGASGSNSNPSNVQGICPNGWHIPSNVEIDQLYSYLVQHNQYVCGNFGPQIAKSLASTVGWNISSSTCAIGNNPSTNNASGFSAYPAGSYYNFYVNFGEETLFWGATDYGSTAYMLILKYNSAQVGRGSALKDNGISVRCVKD